MELKIAHFYPDLMSLYGSYANVSVLRRYLEALGCTVTVQPVRPGEGADIAGADFLFMGAGTERAQRFAAGDFVQYGPTVKALAEDGCAMLFAGTAMELLGASVTDKDGETYSGIGLAAFTTVQGSRRIVGDVYGTTDLFPEAVVGFMNKCSLTHGVTTPLFSSLSLGFGNDQEGGGEGYASGNVLATHITGPVLVKNPDFLDLIIRRLFAAKGWELPEALPSFPHEREAYEVTLRELKNRIGGLVRTDGPSVRLVGDVIQPGETVVLVIPIDSSAPKGRLILPQQQAIRDILELGASALVTRETELADTLGKLKEPPALVVTDSQAFKLVDAVTPKEIPLTSFSILMARYKGFLAQAVEGVAAIDRLRDGDTVLISEGCTHHRQCEDIGTVKIPNWLRKYTGKELQIETSSGLGFPDDLSKYRLIIHCGGCMLNAREMVYRQKCAADAGIPFTNYGITIAYVNGILRRSLEIFPELLAMLPKE